MNPNEIIDALATWNAKASYSEIMPNKLELAKRKSSRSDRRSSSRGHKSGCFGCAGRVYKRR